jgi:serine/threonine protein kinase
MRTMVDYLARGRMMVFKPNQLMVLPELAAHVGLASPEFRVDRIIKGGMGECIRIVQSERAFALKVIQGGLVESPEAWSRYLREVRLWTTLSACVGVVEAFCILKLNELPVVCSHWMDGGNLRPLLRNRSPNSFFSVMSRIVGTLRWAH